MQIEYNKGLGVAIAFSMKEIHIALQILRGLYNFCGAEFIKEAIDDIEEDLKPKQIQHTNYHHLCFECFREIDERNPDTLKITHNEDVKWKCRVCKPLKPDSEREK